MSNLYEKKYKIALCRWNGEIGCVYLNDYRIAGEKPWAGGTVIREWEIALSDLLIAVPELKVAVDGYVETEQTRKEKSDNISGRSP